LLTGNQGFDLPQSCISIARLLSQHLGIEILRLGKISTLLGPTGDRHQVVVIRVLHQQGNGLRLLSGSPQAIGAGHQYVALQAGVQFTHGGGPLRLGQLLQHAQGTGISIGTRQVKRIGIQCFGVLPLTANQLLEAVICRTRLVDFTLGVCQAVSQPRFIGGQLTNLAEQRHDLRPVLACRRRVGLLVQLVQRHALAQPGEVLLTGRRQAIEKILGFLW